MRLLVGIYIAIAVHRGQIAQAARFAGVVRSINELAGSDSDTTRSLLKISDYLKAVRTNLGEATFAKAVAEGRAMTVERAVEEVLADTMT